MKGSAASRIESALLDEIAAGLIEPGERLDETRLATRFGTSRTPVREALSRLLAAGITVQGTTSSSRGMRVAEYDEEELAEMFEAMHELEVVCAGIAANRLTLLERSRLEAAQRECVEAAEAGDRARYLHANEAFHVVIYAATKNRYIARIAADFRRRTGPFRARKFATADDLRASADAHAQLMERILSHDPHAARTEMGEHMRRAYLDTMAAH